MIFLDLSLRMNAIYLLVGCQRQLFENMVNSRGLALQVHYFQIEKQYFIMYKSDEALRYLSKIIQHFYETDRKKEQAKQPKLPSKQAIMIQIQETKNRPNEPQISLVSDEKQRQKSKPYEIQQGEIIKIEQEISSTKPETFEDKNEQYDQLTICQSKFFHWSHFINHIYSFNFVIVDAPWRRGPKPSIRRHKYRPQSGELKIVQNTKFMLSGVDRLCEQGFMFMFAPRENWCQQLQIMNKCGFEYIDQKIWMRDRDPNKPMYLSNFEVVLIGYKPLDSSRSPFYNYRIQKFISNSFLKYFAADIRDPDATGKDTKGIKESYTRIYVYTEKHEVTFAWNYKNVLKSALVDDDDDEEESSYIEPFPINYEPFEDQPYLTDA